MAITVAQAKKVQEMKKAGASFREMDKAVFGVKDGGNGTRSFYTLRNIQRLLGKKDAARMKKKAVKAEAKAKKTAKKAAPEPSTA